MAETQTAAQAQTAAQNGWTISRVMTLAALVLIGLFVALFLLAFILALNNAEGAASFMAYLKDLTLIAVALQCILIITALAVFFIQLARFFNLLRHEAKPLSEDARDALATVKQTTQFVAKHSTDPLIQTQSFLAGLSAFLRELFRWRRLFARKKDQS